MPRKTAKRVAKPETAARGAVELDESQLDRVRGGATVTLSDFHFTKTVDKTSP